MIDQRIVDDYYTRPAIARTDPARPMRRHIRVVHPRMTFDIPPMHNTKEAKQVQPEEDRAKQKPVRDGFLSIHSQL